MLSKRSHSRGSVSTTPHNPPKVQAHSFSRCAKVAPFCADDFLLYLRVDGLDG